MSRRQGTGLKLAQAFRHSASGLETPPFGAGQVSLQQGPGCSEKKGLMMKLLVFFWSPLALRTCMGITGKRKDAGENWSEKCAVKAGTCGRGSSTNCFGLNG